MEKIRVPAPAKINLSLAITGLREDGFHELEMIMQSISLHDIVKIKKVSQGIILNTNHEHLTDGRDNLAYKAAELMLNRFNLDGGLDIYIDKKIPIAAGLAGGSTDAAAVINGVNKLFRLNLNSRKLRELAAEIGSDVPFCIQGGTVLATGRGTKIKQLPDIKKQQIIIVCPMVKIDTAEIYDEYDKLKEKKDFPFIPTNKLLNLIKNNKKIKWNEGWNNVLEQVTINECSEIERIKNILRDKQVKFCLMSGSGPAVFAITDNKEKVNSIINNWPRKEDLLFAVSTVRKDFKELWV